MPGKCAFNDMWMSEREKWLCPVNNDKHKAYCNMCKSKFDVSQGGITSIKKHEKGKKHQSLINLLQFQSKIMSMNVNSVKNDAKISSQEITSEIVNQHSIVASGSGGTSSMLNNYIIKDKVTEAEILWVLYIINLHVSSRSGGNASNVFKRMFSDSIIAEKFKMHKDKLSYVATYGLGPHFQNELVRELNKCDYFSLSLDESLNKVSQRNQMDIVVRYFDKSKNSVISRYLTSTFLGHAKAVDLLSAFTSCISELGLPLSKVIQIETDGPNVNLKFLRDFADHVKNDFESKLLDIGTCSLHVVHGCYKTAHTKSGWHINEFLRCIYYLFKDFPCRRADFKHFSGSSSFPLKLCAIRWIENATVIERAINLIPSLKLYVEGVKDNPPASKNFDKLLKSLKDDLLLAKLHFLQSVASELEIFLKEFQSEKPLLPFLYEELSCLLKSIAVRFLKAEVVSVKNLRDLLLIDVAHDKNICLPIKKIDIGFGAARCCSEMSDTQNIEFRRDCRDFFITLYQKLQVKSPLCKKLVKGVSCISPEVMLSDSLRESRISLALKEFIEKKHITPIDADNIKKTYMKVCENSVVKSMLKSYNRKMSLDTFLMDVFASLNENDPLLIFVKKILSMFHGNAAVERGFSINKECLVDNLEEQSLIAQRAIHSAVVYHGGIEEIPINKSLIVAVRNASSKRQEALAEKKNKQTSKENEIKNAAIELKELKKRKLQLMQQAKEEEEILQKQIEMAEKKIRTS